MTPAKYIVCRFAQAFGFHRRNVRMSDAASEMHLLKEAEAFLGKEVWSEVEDVEKLSIEYWNLRKLIKERDRVSGELERHLAELEKANEERANLLTNSNEPFKDLMIERQNILGRLENLTHDRDIIVAKARDIRRIYDGIKTKEEVLATEQKNTPEANEKSSRRLAELREEFASLKAERLVVAEMIAAGEAEVDEIDRQIKARKKERRERAYEAFQHIGDANQEISNLRAEFGVIETQMRQLYTEIGRHVSRGAAKDPECRKAARNHQGLVDVMGALRKSVTLNQKLSEKA